MINSLIFSLCHNRHKHIKVDFSYLYKSLVTKSDKHHIMHRFIDTFETPLLGLIQVEEKQLEFNTNADCTAKLERCCQTRFATNSAATLRLK